MKNFCSATWEEVNINLGSRFIKYCCHSSSIRLPEVLTVDWILNNLEIQGRKQAMLADQRHAHCQICYKQEDENGTSIRFLKNTIDTQHRIIKNPSGDYFKKIEISFDNICNQSCIYCDETHSSLIAEEKGLPIKFRKHTEEDIEVLANWISTIETSEDNPKILKFLGGEPTASKNYFSFIEKLIESSSDKHFIVHTITNGNTSDKILNKIDQYIKSAKNWKWVFGISNEATGAIAENVRFKLDINQFDKALEFYANHDNVYFVTFSMSQNIFTIKDLPNYFKYVDDKFVKSKKNYGFAYNWVANPEVLHPKYLPNDFKRFIQETRNLVNNTTSNVDKPSLLNYLSQLEKIIGTEQIDMNRLISWLDIAKKQKNGTLNTELLLSQLTI